MHAKLLSQVAALNAAGVTVANYCSQFTVYCTGDTGVTAGKVKILTAPTHDYAGTWHLLKEFTVINGGTEIYQFYGPVGAVKAIVSTLVENGHVDIDLWGW